MIRVFSSQVGRSANLLTAKGKIKLIKGNLVDAETEAIVSSANCNLEGSKRLQFWWNFAGKKSCDAAIHEKAGPELLQELQKIPKSDKGVRLAEGDAVLTKSFGQLRSRYIIHCVVPSVTPGTPTIFPHERDALESAYRNIFRLSEENSIRSIAIPALGCGANGWNVKVAATVAFDSASAHLRNLESIEFRFFDEHVMKQWDELWKEQWDQL
eukprot:g4025.t1